MQRGFMIPAASFARWIFEGHYKEIIYEYA